MPGPSPSEVPPQTRPRQHRSRQHRSLRSRHGSAAVRRARTRRAIAAGSAGLAVLVGLSVVRSPGPDGPVDGPMTVVAVRAVPAGQVLTSADLHLEPRDGRTRPTTASAETSDFVGHRAAVAVAPGEVLTPARVLGPGLLAGQPDSSVAVTIPALAASLDGVRPGARVDVLATGTGQAAVSGAVVLAVGGPVRSGAGAVGALAATGTGASLTLAVPRSQAPALARQLSLVSAGEGLLVAVLPDA